MLPARSIAPTLRRSALSLTFRLNDRFNSPCPIAWLTPSEMPAPDPKHKLCTPQDRQTHSHRLPSSERTSHSSQRSPHALPETHRTATISTSETSTRSPAPLSDKQSSSPACIPDSHSDLQ